VMRATIGLGRQNSVRISGKTAIRKKHCLNAHADLFIRQEQKVLPRTGLSALGPGFIPCATLARQYVSFVDIPTIKS
jgi:hypothetical protein